MATGLVKIKMTQDNTPKIIEVKKFLGKLEEKGYSTDRIFQTPGEQTQDDYLPEGLKRYIEAYHRMPSGMPPMLRLAYEDSLKRE